MTARDIGIFALLGANVLLLVCLLLWYLRGRRRGPYGSTGRWRHLGLYYFLIVMVIAEMTIIGVMLFG